MKPTQPHLIEAFRDEDFGNMAYFAMRYNVIPSSIRLTLHPEDVNDIVHEVFDHFLSGPFSMKLSYQKWSLDPRIIAEDSNDHPNNFFFESESHPVFMEAVMRTYTNELFLDLMFGLETKEIEEWGLKVFQSLRKRFGLKVEEPSREPYFSILAQGNRGEFYTQHINTNDFGQVDIEASYNDDFVRVNSIIGKSIEADESGLIMLHGRPGTGKTSYVKHLISKHAEKEFIFIQNDLVQSLLMPAFITFLIDRKNSILIIEDAERVIMPREASGGASITSTILQLTDGLFSDYLNIKVICTFNSSIQKVDKALLRKGRLIANYEFRALAKEKANVLLESIGGEPVDTGMTLAEIYNQKKADFEQDYVMEKVGF